MAKKQIKVRNTQASNRKNSDLSSDYPLIHINENIDIKQDLINSGINEYSPDNIPQDWELLKKEIQFLENLNVKSNLILAHRLCYIRDNELYKKDGFTNMGLWVEEFLNISKSKAYFLMAVVDLFPFRPGGIEKIKNLEIALPVIRNNLDQKEEIFNRSQELSKSDFLSYLARFNEEIKEDNFVEKEEWAQSFEEIYAHSKVVREGMKRSTVKRDTKDYLNWLLLNDPKNKALRKIKDLWEKV